MAQCVTGGLVVAAKQIDEENIFPRSPAHGARLNLAQADVAKREDTQGFEQRAGDVFDAERQGSLISASSRLSRSPMNQKKARKVLLVVLDPCFKNLSFVNIRRSATG